MTPDRRKVLRGLATAMAAAGLTGRAVRATPTSDFMVRIGTLLTHAYNPLFAAGSLTHTRDAFMARYVPATGMLTNPFTGASQTYPFGGGYSFGAWMSDPAFPGTQAGTVLGATDLAIWQADLQNLEPAVRAQLTGIVVHFLVNSISGTFSTALNAAGVPGHHVQVGALTTAAGAQFPTCAVTMFCPS